MGGTHSMPEILCSPSVRLSLRQRFPVSSCASAALAPMFTSSSTCREGGGRVLGAFKRQGHASSPAACVSLAASPCEDSQPQMARFHPTSHEYHSVGFAGTRLLSACEEGRLAGGLRFTCVFATHSPAGRPWAFNSATHCSAHCRLREIPACFRSCAIRVASISCLVLERCTRVLLGWRSTNYCRQCSRRGQA